MKSRRKITVEEQWVAIAEYQRDNPDRGNFNGITIAACAEYFYPKQVVHLLGKGFFVEDAP